MVKNEKCDENSHQIRILTKCVRHSVQDNLQYIF